jgi:Pyridoxal-dependent decarboxylase, pyridoxal binding domain
MCTHESQVPDLLKEVKKLGMKVVGVSFHVGSGMCSTNLCYIYLCKLYCSVDTVYAVATGHTTFYAFASYMHNHVMPYELCASFC